MMMMMIVMSILCRRTACGVAQRFRRICRQFYKFRCKKEEQFAIDRSLISLSE
jgi:hypothetical protein